MKGKTCCVTGHRDLPQNEINKIKAALEHEIDAAVTDGFTCFMSSFAVFFLHLRISGCDTAGIL